MKLQSYVNEISNIISLKKHAPRWVILFLDMIITLFSIFFAFLLRFNFDMTNIFFSNFLNILLFVVSIRLVFFIASKSYAGIIRYTSTKDAVRIIFVITLSNTTYFIGNLFFYFFWTPESFLIPVSVIAIDFFISIFAMTTYRLIVKSLYLEAGDSLKAEKRGVIVGIGEEAMIVKRAVKQNYRKRFKIEAFIDPENIAQKKQLDSIPVYKTNKLKKILEKHDISELFFATYNLDPKKKQAIIETCLNYNVKTYTVPEPHKWIDGTLSIKQLRKINIEDLLERPPISLDSKKIGETLKNKKVMVTGAAGSIGSETVKQLIPFEPEMIIVFDQAESPLYELELELREKYGYYNFKIVIGDIKDKVRTKKVFDTFKPKIIFHAAAYKHVPMMEDNPYEAVNTNIFGTKNIADLAVESGVQKFIMVSTDKAVNPTNIMGATKRVAEIYTQTLNKTSKTQFITTRFGNVLGSNGSVIKRFENQIKKNNPVTVTHPDITRYFMTIPEACQLILQASSIGNGGEIFIFDMGKSVKILELAKKMIRLSGLNLGTDITIKFTGLRQGEKLYEELLNDKEKTIPTTHSKIMVAKVRSYEIAGVNNQLEKLYEKLSTHNNFNIVGQLKRIVPEFKSKNSIFENLDKKL
ncbi:MAG: nucleoside-diphosphate sugar epimerase/dehydratase [Bacteroidota bacterium]|nr:nucleoside-diphosphate sugar epimerase/dehydratase [Bacteroidota bacterium]